MSRMTAPLLIALSAAPAAAQPVTAEQAVNNYRDAFRSLKELDCPKGADPEEVVVCGRRDRPDPARLPLRTAPEPGRRIQGEAVSTVAAAGKRETCSTVGPNPQCGGGLPILGIAATVAKAAVRVAEKILDPDE